MGSLLESSRWDQCSDFQLYFFPFSSFSSFFFLFLFGFGLGSLGGGGDSAVVVGSGGAAPRDRFVDRKSVV